MVKVVVIFYSLYTHTWQLARAIVEGAKMVEDVEVEMYQVPELLPEEVIAKMGATQPKEAMKHIPVITSDIRKDVIKSADAIFFGSPTRFGIMTAQMKSFFDALGGLWFENACVGKVASCFTGSGTQHGGQETTLFSMITPILHLGFVYVGLPYSCKEQKDVSEVSGGSPYGATFIAGSDGSRAVSANELACARYQGRYVAQFAKELIAGRMHLGKVPTGSSTTTTTTAASITPATPPKETTPAVEPPKKPEPENSYDQDDVEADKPPKEKKEDKPDKNDEKPKKKSSSKSSSSKKGSSSIKDGKADKKSAEKKSSKDKKAKEK